MKDTDVKKKLHEIVDRLPAEEILTAEKILESLLLYREKYGKQLAEEKYNAWLDSLPEDDEELSEECLKRIEESEKEYREGHYSTFDEVAKELGI